MSPNYLFCSELDERMQKLTKKRLESNRFVLRDVKSIVASSFKTSPRQHLLMKMDWKCILSRGGQVEM